MDCSSWEPLLVQVNLFLPLFPPSSLSFSWSTLPPKFSLVVGPIFGGLLGAVDFGEGGLESWRLIFFVISGLSALIFTISIPGLKETMVRDYSVPVPCVNPFSPLLYLKYFRVCALLLAFSIGFAGLFVVNITFPNVLGEAYGKPPVIVGLCYLPLGGGLIIGAMIGGRSADRMRKKGGTAEHRLVPSLLFFPLNGAVILGQGWVYQYAESLDLSVALIMSFFIGLTFILPRPGVNTYVIEKLRQLENKDLASSATGLIFGIMFPTSAVIAQLSVSGSEAIGIGYFLTIVGGSLILASIPVIIFVVRDIKKSKQEAHGASFKGTSSGNTVTYGSVN